jgi:Na+/melibiose symporter-like transporter
MHNDRRSELYYGSISFYITSLNTLFILYHVDAYLNIYRIDKTSFWIGETVFMLWNSFNDPLFGWLSDRTYLSSIVPNLDFICRKRVLQLKLFGPLLAIVFALIWFPLLSSHFICLQFTLCLCLYDTFLTIIDLQYTSLLADLSIDSIERNRFNYYSSLFSALASISVFISYFIWCSENVHNFQQYCLFITIISLFGFYFSSNYLLKQHQLSKGNVVGPISSDDNQQSNDKSVFRFIKCLSKHKNLLYFSLMNLIQVIV